MNRATLSLSLILHLLFNRSYSNFLCISTADEASLKEIIKSKAIAALTQALNEKTELDLSYNRIGVEGAESVATALQNNDTLTPIMLKLRSMLVGY